MFRVLHRSERKEALLKQKEKEKINERRKEELKRAEKKDKDKQAISEYEKWLVGVARDELPSSLALYSFSASLSHPVFLGDYLAFPPLQLRLPHGLSFLAALLRLPKARELAAGVMFQPCIPAIPASGTSHCALSSFCASCL